MAFAATTFSGRVRPKGIQSLYMICRQYRFQSSASARSIVNGSGSKSMQNDKFVLPVAYPSPLARLPISSILRSLFLSSFFTSPLLFRPGFAIFQKIANSKSIWLNPDQNPFLRAVIRPLIYDQFCAGRNEAEIHKTASEIKRLGFSGVVLCYGKEVQVCADNVFLGYDSAKMKDMDAEIDQWRDGNLATLDMIGEGDWLGIKYTGAGLHITEALIHDESTPTKFTEAMDTICKSAAARGCRIWIDAEQQILQATIDKWTFDFMRRFNKTGQQALIYNTIQAYLKSSRDKVRHQVELSQKEGWRLGIKLVRGAYISNDMRERIHDTKADTDASYNSIVNDLLSRRLPSLADNQSPEIDLLLAGHNSHSIRQAASMASELAAASNLKVIPEFGQLQGMADDIGCELLQMADDVKRETSSPLVANRSFSPKVYKCLTWGSIQECMQYLTRRLVENRGAADRMKAGAGELKRELSRRTMGRFWRSA